MSGSGFRGPECLECGGIRSEVRESGYTVDGQRIRRRACLDCGQDACSVEVYIDPEQTTFWKLNPHRAAMKRASDSARRWKGVYRLPNRRFEPDRLGVIVTVGKGGKVPVTQCRRGHDLTPENVYITPGSGYRDCVTCRKTRQAERKAVA